MSIQNVTVHVGPQPITIETGKLARLADGAVTVRSGESIVLVSAVSATTIKEGQDWFPLTVDYREKAAAGGKFPGRYFMIEGEGKEVPEDEFVKALAFAQEQVTRIVLGIKELVAKAGKAKRQAPLFVVKDELLEIAYQVAGDRIEAAIYTPSKVARGKAV